VTIALGCALFRRGKRRYGYVKQRKPAALFPSYARDSRDVHKAVHVVGRRIMPRGITPPSSLEAHGWRALHLLTAAAESSHVIGYPQENEIRIMTLRKICILLSLLAGLLVPVSCNHSVVTRSKLTLSNYDQITTGMTKAQVERILGPPTTVETKDMMIFKKTTYRYEDGKKFAMFTFKNDELDSKEGNLQREP
jgi:hypothetical protein